MFRKLDDFIELWENHAHEVEKILGKLTDTSLPQQVDEGHRTLGRIAWHITQSIVEMAQKTGLTVAGPEEHCPVPTKAVTILEEYSQTAHALVEEIRNHWTDETLEVADDMYGRKWPRGLTLYILLTHEIHHVGQITVLMRQAGLVVPGIFGPAKEEWIAYGRTPPAI